jgi:hypothetical protein
VLEFIVKILALLSVPRGFVVTLDSGAVRSCWCAT